MEKITFSFEKESWELEQRETRFLYSYLLRFGVKNNINIFNNNDFRFPNEFLEGLIDIFKNALSDLANDCYQEPSLKNKQKNSSKYEKIIIGNKKLTVDYVHSVTGRLMFLLNTRIETLQEVYDNNHLFIIKSEGFEKYDW